MQRWLGHVLDQGQASLVKSTFCGDITARTSEILLFDFADNLCSDTMKLCVEFDNLIEVLLRQKPLAFSFQPLAKFTLVSFANGLHIE